jgi:hypothetical protein
MVWSRTRLARNTTGANCCLRMAKKRGFRATCMRLGNHGFDLVKLARPTLEPRDGTRAAQIWADDETEVFAPICAEKGRGMPGCGSRPCSREPPLVEAGGQYIHGFRRGLDYAFIRPLMERMDAERIIRLIESVGS